MSGYTGIQFEELYNLQGPVTKNTYTSTAVISAPGATAVPRCLISANYFSVVGKSIRFVFRGTFSSAAGTAGTMFAGGLNQTTGLATVGGANLFTSSGFTQATGTFPFDGDFDLTASAVGNLATTLQCNGILRVGAIANQWATNASTAMFANVITSLDNEKQLYLELFGAWSASAAGNGSTLMQLKVFGEN